VSASALAAVCRRRPLVRSGRASADWPPSSLLHAPATPDIYTLSLHDALPISKPLQLKLLTTYIPKTSAFTLAFSTSQRLRTTRASARTFFTFRHYITPSARNF